MSFKNVDEGVREWDSWPTPSSSTMGREGEDSCPSICGGKGSDPVALWRVSPEPHLGNTVQRALMVQVLHSYRYRNIKIQPDPSL